MNFCARIETKHNKDHLYPNPPMRNVARSSYSGNPTKRPDRKKPHEMRVLHIVL